MKKIEHTRLLKRLNVAATAPDKENKLDESLANAQQLQNLIDNLNEDEYIACASSGHSYIQTAIVPLDQLANSDINNLLSWHISPTACRVSYSIGGDRRETSLEDCNFLNCGLIKKSQPLLFDRMFDGMTDSTRDYYELLQEFSHISDIHWHNERDAYCKFDEYGDLDDIVSISKEPIKFVTVNREILDNYLYLSKSAIIRAFDFSLVGRGFNRWNQNTEETKHMENTHFRQCLHSSSTRGFQIITPKDNDETIYSRISPFSSDKKIQYVEFIAHDWRNKTVRKISTDPSATTNYFVQKEGLPFELSYAFFQPDVLSRYKADKDKYTINTRRITCRTAWCLERYDINEAGQIHVYICDLRKLPYKEQKYWKVFNEKPKAGISKRARIQDFEAGWHAPVDPLDKVKRKLQDWCDSKMTWWVLKDDSLFKNVTCPLTENKDEWADAFLRFAELVVAGLRPKKIKEALKQANIDHEKGVLSIKLLELLCESDFPALSEIQTIRNFKAHAKEAELNAHSKEIQKKHGDYPQHFNSVCERLLAELDIIEAKLKDYKT